MKDIRSKETKRDLSKSSPSDGNVGVIKTISGVDLVTQWKDENVTIITTKSGQNQKEKTTIYSGQKEYKTKEQKIVKVHDSSNSEGNGYVRPSLDLGFRAPGRSTPGFEYPKLEKTPEIIALHPIQTVNRTLFDIKSKYVEFTKQKISEVFESLEQAEKEEIQTNYETTVAKIDDIINEVLKFAEVLVDWEFPDDLSKTLQEEAAKIDSSVKEYHKRFYVSKLQELMMLKWCQKVDSTVEANSNVLSVFVQLIEGLQMQAISRLSEFEIWLAQGLRTDPAGISEGWPGIDNFKSLIANILDGIEIITAINEHTLFDCFADTIESLSKNGITVNDSCIPKYTDAAGVQKSIFAAMDKSPSFGMVNVGPIPGKYTDNISVFKNGTLSEMPAQKEPGYSNKNFVNYTLVLEALDIIRKTYRSESSDKDLQDIFWVNMNYDVANENFITANARLSSLVAFCANIKQRCEIPGFKPNYQSDDEFFFSVFDYWNYESGGLSWELWNVGNVRSVDRTGLSINMDDVYAWRRANGWYQDHKLWYFYMPIIRTNNWNKNSLTGSITYPTEAYETWEKLEKNGIEHFQGIGFASTDSKKSELLHIADITDTIWLSEVKKKLTGMSSSLRAELAPANLGDDWDKVVDHYKRFRDEKVYSAYALKRYNAPYLWAMLTSLARHVIESFVNNVHSHLREYFPTIAVSKADVWNIFQSNSNDRLIRSQKSQNVFSMICSFLEKVPNTLNDPNVSRRLMMDGTLSLWTNISNSSEVITTGTYNKTWASNYVKFRKMLSETKSFYLSNTPELLTLELEETLPSNIFLSKGHVLPLEYIYFRNDEIDLNYFDKYGCNDQGVPQSTPYYSAGSIGTNLSMILKNYFIFQGLENSISDNIGIAKEFGFSDELSKYIKNGTIDLIKVNKNVDRYVRGVNIGKQNLLLASGSIFSKKYSKPLEAISDDSNGFYVVCGVPINISEEDTPWSLNSVDDNGLLIEEVLGEEKSRVIRYFSYMYGLEYTIDNFPTNPNVMVPRYSKDFMENKYNIFAHSKSDFDETLHISTVPIDSSWNVSPLFNPVFIMDKILANKKYENIIVFKVTVPQSGTITYGSFQFINRSK